VGSGPAAFPHSRTSRLKKAGSRCPRRWFVPRYGASNAS
jgi:hypothetical protein